MKREIVKIRLEPGLKLAAEAAASIAGESLSELVRRGMRAESTTVVETAKDRSVETVTD